MIPTEKLNLVAQEIYGKDYARLGNARRAKVLREVKVNDLIEAREKE